MTGALNPIHRGHISIMIKTREHLERVNNFNVIAGYISPTHDDYVRRKLKNELILGRHRIEMCRRAIDEARQQHWLSIDKAECVAAFNRAKELVSNLNILPLLKKCNACELNGLSRNIFDSIRFNINSDTYSATDADSSSDSESDYDDETMESNEFNSDLINVDEEDKDAATTQSVDEIKTEKINFTVRTALNIEARTIHDELSTVFGDEAPSYRTVARWAQWFRPGREEIEDEERSRRPVTESTLENIEEIRSIVSDDPHVTIAELQEHTGLSYGTLHAILFDHLELGKITARYIPKQLMDYQRSERVQICKENLSRFEEGRWRLCDVVTGDESWFFHQ
ncbi:unnamed protein product [Rotaria sp. Silwood1]|nr:unnamed protein product [Rotaria sp. Silwood1]